MIEVLEKPTEVKLELETKPRICHILDEERRMSVCGLKPFAGHEHEIHTKFYCKIFHQLCALCTVIEEGG